jgi:hypothetical protein
MIVWLLRDGDAYRTGLGGSVPVGQIGSYADVCAHHVADFVDEPSARAEAEAANRAEAAGWAPVAVDFEGVGPEDFEEHFED